MKKNKKRKWRKLRELKIKEREIELTKKLTSVNLKICRNVEDIANEARVLLENSKDELKEVLDHFKETVAKEKIEERKKEKLEREEIERQMRNNITTHVIDRANFLQVSQANRLKEGEKIISEKIVRIEKAVHENANNNFLKELSLGKDVEKLRKIENYSLENIKANYEHLMKDLISEKEKEFQQLINEKMKDIMERNEAFKLGREYELENLKKRDLNQRSDIRNPIKGRMPNYVLEVRERKAEKFFKDSAKVHLREAFTIKPYLDTTESMPYDSKMTADEWELQKTINSYAYARTLGLERKAQRLANLY